MSRASFTAELPVGARLAWLIHPFKRSVYIYRPQQPIEVLKNPTEVSGDPELPGFVLELKPIFDLEN